MQLSIDPEMNVQELVIKLNGKPSEAGFTVLLTAKSRHGVLLASAGLKVEGFRVTDLLPSLLSEVGYGWLTGSSIDMVTLPSQAFRARRKSLTRADAWGITSEGRGALSGD